MHIFHKLILLINTLRYIEAHNRGYIRRDINCRKGHDSTTLYYVPTLLTYLTKFYNRHTNSIPPIDQLIQDSEESKKMLASIGKASRPTVNASSFDKGKQKDRISHPNATSDVDYEFGENDNVHSNHESARETRNLSLLNEALNTGDYDTFLDNSLERLAIGKVFNIPSNKLQEVVNPSKNNIHSFHKKTLGQTPNSRSGRSNLDHKARTSMPLWRNKKPELAKKIKK